MSSWVTSTQFYIYGCSHFTSTGWKKEAKDYVPLELEGAKLGGKFYMVTGANSGLGRETAKFLASRGATVFMVCRNAQRAETARAEILAELDAAGACDVARGELKIVLGDVSLAASVLEIAKAIRAQAPALDGLVCNAGALSNTKTMTAEGVETTFAAHLAFGSYLLSRELTPLLLKSASPRVVFVTSGGMYNHKFPGVEPCLDPSCYDGQMAYVYAKRGQVLLAERLAVTTPEIVWISSHPGWTDTSGVDAAYGEQKSYLEPMRNLWQGAEGQCWCAVVDRAKLEPGALYLDRKPQCKHLAGWFIGEGTGTKNTPADVESMVADLDMLVAKAATVSAKVTATLKKESSARFMGALKAHMSADSPIDGLI